LPLSKLLMATANGSCKTAKMKAEYDNFWEHVHQSTEDLHALFTLSRQVYTITLHAPLCLLCTIWPWRACARLQGQKIGCQQPKRPFSTQPFLQSAGDMHAVFAQKARLCNKPTPLQWSLGTMWQGSAREWPLPNRTNKATVLRISLPYDQTAQRGLVILAHTQQKYSENPGT
jgi:hypothetical protein